MSESARVAFAFGIAFIAAIIGTPLARRLAIRLNVFDQPREGKSHLHPTPYLGGLAIIGGFAISVAGTGAWRALGGIAVGAALLGVLGVADDIKDLGVVTRFGVQAVAAAVVVASGVHVSPTGVHALDLGISFVWIVGITNAFNLLDNMNGLSSGIAAIGAAAYLSMALLGGQHLVAGLAAAVLGAALGFLPYNFPRAQIFMGDGGSLLLGFLLATIALKLRLPDGHGWNLAAKVCVLGVAVVDTSIVVLDRARARRRLFVGATDHLSHRLVVLGISPVGAVVSLHAVAAALGVVAVLAERRVITPWAMAGAGLVAVASGLFLLRVPVLERWEKVSTGDEMVVQFERAHPPIVGEEPTAAEA